MKVERNATGQLYYIYSKYSDENPMIKNYGEVYLHQDEVLHIPGLGFNGLIGYSPIAMAKNAIGMSLDTEEYGASFFSNGASPGGVLEHPGIVKDPQRIRESWNSVYQGSNNAHRVAVLEEGMAFKPITDKILVWAPFNSEWGAYDEIQMIKGIADSSEITNQVDIISDEAATADALKNMSDYGLIILASHGGWQWRMDYDRGTC